MKRKFAILFWLLTMGWVSFLSAQVETELDSLYLPNGKLITGYLQNSPTEEYIIFESLYNDIIEVGEEDEKIRIHLFAGGQISLPRNYIKSIHENSISRKPILSADNLDSKGLYGITSIGFSSGSSSRFNNTFSTGRHLNFILGYQWTPHLLTGIGIGADIHEVDPINDLAFTTVYADVRYFILKKSVTPYISLGVGYGISKDMEKEVLSSKHTSGLMLNPKLGIKLSPNWLEGIFLYAGYKIQKTIFEKDNNVGGSSYIYIHDLELRRFELGLGFVF